MNAQISQFISDLLQATTALLIVLNPLGLVPMIASVTRHLEPKAQRKLIGQVAMIGSALLLAFTYGGSLILSIFDITLADLRVAGGLLLLSIAFSFVLKGSMSGDDKLQNDIAAAPIASPILVGPGAITTAVVLVRGKGELVTTIAVIIASLVTWLVFRSAPKVFAVIRESGADIIVRIMGILLAAIAVVYVRKGLADLLPLIR